MGWVSIHTNNDGSVFVYGFTTMSSPIRQSFPDRATALAWIEANELTITQG
jgi:hypothetical protein